MSKRDFAGYMRNLKVCIKKLWKQACYTLSGNIANIRKWADLTQRGWGRSSILRGDN